MDQQPFITQEAILAYCLYIAGIPFVDDRQPCSNLFDKEILFKLGGGREDSSGNILRQSSFSGLTLEEAANLAWQKEARGDVRYYFQMTPRTGDLIRCYREQCTELETSDMKASDVIYKILSHGSSNSSWMESDEMLLRISCVILKTRGEFMNIWKKMVPLLRIPLQGKTKHFDTTVITPAGDSRKAQGVQKPGFKLVSLNASAKTKKALKLYEQNTKET